MLMLHANWTDGAMRLWAEFVEALRALGPPSGDGERPRETAGEGEAALEHAALHPFAVPGSELARDLLESGLLPPDVLDGPSSFRIRLPADDSEPWPSDRLASVLGVSDRPVDPALALFQVPCVTLAPDRVLAAVLAMENQEAGGAIEFGYSLRFWMTVVRFVTELLVDQRFLPTLIQSRGEGLKAAWQPWLHDEPIRARVGALLQAMPPVARAVIDQHEGNPWLILDDALRTLTDLTIRQALRRENFAEALLDRDPQTDPHVAWLSGLLGSRDDVSPPPEAAMTMFRNAARWVGRLDDTGQDRPLRLCLRLNEPAQSQALRDLAPIADTVLWRLSLHLQATEEPKGIIDAEELWARASSGRRFGGRFDDYPQELLLTELARAGRVFPLLERALSESAPTGIDLSTSQAYEFLTEYKPVLEESGIVVMVPSWWGEPSARLGARLQVQSPKIEATLAVAGGGQGAGRAVLGLSSFVQYRWQVAVGDQPLAMDEFRALANQSAALVRVRGRWVEIRPEQMAAATKFLSDRPGGEMTLLEAMRLVYGADGRRSGLPVLGMDATGWVRDLLTASGPDQTLPSVDQPDGFRGALRPYQKSGLSWLSFLDRLGLGACLADDMGLGKTIQLIALLLHERQHAPPGDRIGPTLLIVPTSLIGNWMSELKRFAPSLTAHVHHGPDRPMGDHFTQIAERTDLIVTTYALISRDQETLDRLHWHRVALDEAQYIKNPPTKQTTAIRSLKAGRRLTLTGTPVENRLSELWSIMEFCNPGYLGHAGEFRRRFAVPIERRGDRRQADHLRRLVQPFILRRVKTDPNVIDDLPPCVVTREFATLTAEQAGLYKQTVESMLTQIDRANGIQRRGRVLAALVKLKQICNHPAQAQKESIAAALPGQPGRTPALSRRSGKALRLLTMLEEILATGEKALIFTQFRQMGHLLKAMIEHDLDTETLFMHGGTPPTKRQQMINRFQSGVGEPVFILSLKAGGVGLNLTAANHVFHFDRWWNPAVENQATDRAFRIGQTRTVHVHKFLCLGTLEERIDQMIEQKTELAEKIIGAGEQWLTELSTQQLRDLLVLRDDAMEVES
ncbi:MAG: DEAD/DEAH box helicase [Phycisphaerales bacterium]|nr:MAG: DEAD/DEAH box helicase [Phycisphaerales bacterium]